MKQLTRGANPAEQKKKQTKKTNKQSEDMEACHFFTLNFRKFSIRPEVINEWIHKLTIKPRDATIPTC